MILIAKTKIKANNSKVYEKGDIITTEISKDDMQRLIDLKAIEYSHFLNAKDDIQIPIELNDIKYDDFLKIQEDEIVFLTEEELKKISSKQKLVEYATSIGLELDTEMRKEELISQIVMYIEEIQDRSILNNGI